MCLASFSSMSKTTLLPPLRCFPCETLRKYSMIRSSLAARARRVVRISWNSSEATMSSG
jgi:hypothetical protein